MEKDDSVGRWKWYKGKKRIQRGLRRRGVIEIVHKRKRKTTTNLEGCVEVEGKRGN